MYLFNIHSQLSWRVEEYIVVYIPQNDIDDKSVAEETHNKEDDVENGERKVNGRAHRFKLQPVAINIQ